MDKNTPTRHPLARVGIVGHPWHGKVEGGSLALPNSTALPYLQPAGARSYQRGAAHLLAVPGTPPVVRTPEQAAADAADGKQWWDRAILAGGECQLYGKPIGGSCWIYVDPDGVRWKVTPPLHNQAPPAPGTPIQFRLDRFGSFGTEPEFYVYDQSFPDLGQSGGAGGVSHEMVNAYRVYLASPHPAGTEAIFAVDASFLSAALWSASSWPDRACAWFKVTLSGPGAACTISIDVLHTYASALGVTVDDDAVPGWPSKQRFALFSESISGDDPIDCVGTQTVTRAITGFVDLPAGQTPAPQMYAQIATWREIGEATYRRAYSGLVLAMGYRPDGTVFTLTYDQDWVMTTSDTAPETTTNSAAMLITREYYPAPLGCSSNDTMTQPWDVETESSSTIATTFTQTLRLDGVQCDQRVHSFSDTEVSRRRVVGGWPATYPGDASPTSTFDHERHRTFTPGATTTDLDAISVPHLQPRDDVPLDVDISLDARLGAVGLWRSAWAGIAPPWMPWVFSTDTEGASLAVLIARHGPALFSFVTDTQLTSGGNRTAKYLSPVATEAGAAVAAEIETAARTTDIFPYLYGSSCPVTEQIARSLNPVCWV